MVGLVPIALGISRMVPPIQAQSFIHQPIHFALWYVNTIPLGRAILCGPSEAGWPKSGYSLCKSRTSQGL